MSIATPPLDLNQHITHEAILQLTGATVKAQLPLIATCPLCNVKMLRVLAVPSGGCWYICEHCGFCGDSIELYQQLYELSNIRDAIYELSAKSILPMTGTELTTEIVNGYVKHIVERRHANAALIKATRKALTGALAGEQQELLYGLRLWRGYSCNKWYEHMSRYAGIGTRKLFETYDIQLPKRGFSTFLVCPFYDVPGRVSMLLLMDKHGKIIRISIKPQHEHKDDGLMMLNTLPDNNNIVYAMADPLLALRLQYLQFSMTEIQPLSIVIYTEDTTDAWQGVRTNKLIFWEDKPSMRLFRQASISPRAFIAAKPTATELSDSDILLHVMINNLNESANHWAAALKHFLLADDYWQACNFMAELALTEPDIQRVYSVCTPAEKQAIQRILGETPRTARVCVGNMEILEYDDAWWIARGKQRELGCNAIIRITQAIHMPDTQQNIYKGVVIFKGKQFEFTVPTEQLETGLDKWLRELLMSNAGVLQLSKALRPHLLELAKQFYQPQYSKQSGKVGWCHERKAFMFPNFGITSTGLTCEMRATILTANSAPFGNLTAEMLTDISWLELMENNETNAAILAIIASIFANILGPAVGISSKPIGVITESSTLGCAAAINIFKQLNLPVITDFKQKLSTQLAAAEQQHSCPVLLDCASAQGSYITQLRADSNDNIIALLTKREVASLSVGESWSFINAAQPVVQQFKLPTICGMLAYLIWICRRNYDMPAATDWYQCVLQSMTAWLADEFKLTDPVVLTRAAALFDTLDKTDVYQRYLRLVYWLTANGYFNCKDEACYSKFKDGFELPASNKAILIDTEQARVYINNNALLKVIHRLKLPELAAQAVMQSFANTAKDVMFEKFNQGFVVSKKVWDLEQQKWQKLRTRLR